MGHGSRNPDDSRSSTSLLLFPADRKDSERWPRGKQSVTVTAGQCSIRDPVGMGLDSPQNQDFSLGLKTEDKATQGGKPK